MGASPVNKIVTQREDMDCCTVTLAMYLGVSYENTLRAVTMTEKRHHGRRGLWTKTMQRVGARLGHTLRRRTAIDWESDYGILLLPDHSALLRNGLIIETDGTVWEADTYLSNRVISRDECELLVADE